MLKVLFCGDRDDSSPLSRRLALDRKDFYAAVVLAFLAHQLLDFVAKITLLLQNRLALHFDRLNSLLPAADLPNLILSNFAVDVLDSYG